MQTIGITGGSGLVGHEIAERLRRRGDTVVIFSRQPNPQNPQQAYWNPATQEIDTSALAKMDAMIHLAGAGVADKRWSEARKQEIRDSRVLGTRFLVDALRQHGHRCKALIAASAIGYYGPDHSGKPFEETDPPGNDFLARTCADWEAESLKATDLMRVAVIRTGIVLSEKGGALPEMTRAFPFRIAPVLGNGRQVVSWITLADLARLYIHVLDQELSGIYNGVALHPLSMRQLMKALAKEKGGPFLFPPVPGFALKLALGEMSTEVLKSTTVSSAKAAAAGFQWETADL